MTLKKTCLGLVTAGVLLAIASCNEDSSDIESGTTLAVAQCVERNKRDEKILGLGNIKRICVKKHEYEIASYFVRGKAGYNQKHTAVVGFSGLLANVGDNHIVTKVSICVQHDDNLGQDGKPKCSYISIDDLWIAPGKSQEFSQRRINYIPKWNRLFEIKDGKREFLYHWGVDRVWGVRILLRGSN